MLHKIKPVLIKLRQTKPLILCLTNNVTMDFMANCLLALGAAPIMSNDQREFDELVQLSASININIGTLDKQFISNAKILAKLAQKYCKPIAFDPVGAGASLLRTKTAHELMPFANIIRGNASEILALAEMAEKTFGVEAAHAVNDAKNSALTLAAKYKCTIAVSGPEDFITNGQQQETLSYGSPIMSKITGMGCALTAIIAAFIAVEQDFFEATKLAIGYFGLCGNLAEHKTNKPGSFRVTFIDALNYEI